MRYQKPSNERFVIHKLIVFKTLQPLVCWKEKVKHTTQAAKPHSTCLKQIPQGVESKKVGHAHLSNREGLCVKSTENKERVNLLLCTDWVLAKGHLKDHVPLFFTFFL